MSRKLMIQSLGLIREEEELLSVLCRELYDDPDYTDSQIGEDEDHSYHERKDEIVIS